MCNKSISDKLRGIRWAYYLGKYPLKRGFQFDVIEKKLIELQIDSLWKGFCLLKPICV